MTPLRRKHGRRRVAKLAALLALAVAPVACAGGPDRTGRPTTAPPTATSSPPSTRPPSTAPPTQAPPTTRPARPPSTIVLTQVAQLDQPLALAVRAGDEALYVAEKSGRVRRVTGGRADPRPVLDVSGDLSRGYEQGLLGIAWSPDGRHLYANYTNASGDTRVIEVEPPNGTPRVLLAVDQPYANHNGGQLAFGPDGLLYIGLGDGGSGGDPHGNAQDLGTLLGKILRIDPRPSGGRPYSVPSDNPFAGRAGARPEIWALGLRNPWRFSFDVPSGELWVGDVGQNRREEVDRAPGGGRGANFGWNRREGRAPFRGGAAAPGMLDPVYDYPTGEGGTCAVVGGFVYRGARLEALLGGQYVFGDTCAGWVRALTPGTGQARDLRLDVEQLSSFGQDGAGELYALSLRGGVYRLDPGP